MGRSDVLFVTVVTLAVLVLSLGVGVWARGPIEEYDTYVPETDRIIVRAPAPEDYDG